MHRPVMSRLLLAAFCTLLLAGGSAAAAERSRRAASADDVVPAEEPAKPAAPKRADLAVESLTLSTATIDRRKTKIRVQVRNVGELTAKATGLIVECFLREGEKTRRPCPGSHPPARLSVPSLTVNAARSFEVPLSRFLLPAGQPGHYEIKALLDTRGKVLEANEYNNARVLRFEY